LIANLVVYNRDMDTSIERQTEINEWSYNSKREALFFSQLVFIALTIIILMFALSRAKILNEIFVYYVMIIIFVLLVLIWYTKYSYTRNSRDKQHWNRITFPDDNNKASTLSPTVLNSIATATIDSCASSPTTTPGSTTTPGPTVGSASGSRNTGQSVYDIRLRPASNSIADVVAWCADNRYSRDPVSGYPCKKIWCYANPDLSWNDQTANQTTPCKQLFPEVSTPVGASYALAFAFSSQSAYEYTSSRRPLNWE